MNSEPFFVEYRISGHFNLNRGLSKAGLFTLRGHMHFPFLPCIGMRYDSPIHDHYARVTEVYLIDGLNGSGALASVTFRITFLGIELNLGQLQDKFPNIRFTKFAAIFRWLLEDRKLTLYQMPGVDLLPSKPIATFDRFLQVCNRDWYDRVHELLATPDAVTPPESSAEPSVESL